MYRSTRRPAAHLRRRRRSWPRSRRQQWRWDYRRQTGLGDASSEATPSASPELRLWRPWASRS
eukprot:13406187-Heterocapsa_arctica.AAC.1